MAWNGFLPPLERVVDRDEMMDRLEDFPPEAIRRALRDLERVNRVFGNHALLIRHLSELARVIPRGRPLTIADIGTGGGDMTAAVARWAAATGRTVFLIAADRSEEILVHAAERLGDVGAARILRADAGRLPFRDRSVDIVFCSQLLHHLSDEGAVAVIAEMDRVARIGWIVSDLRRGRIAHRVTRAGIWLTSRSPMIRYDGPLSILRAFTMEEYRRLARRAGAPEAEVVRHAFFRAAILRRTPVRTRARARPRVRARRPSVGAAPS